MFVLLRVVNYFRIYRTMQLPITALILFLISVSSNLLAQSFQLNGQILDETDRSGVISANVKLISLSDTTQWRGALTDADGYFRFSDLASGKYRLTISYIGYTPISRFVMIQDADKNLGPISMNRSATQLKDVTITEEQVRVKQKEDTSEYNAAAYKTSRDASAEDLITKMPGITSENGTIKAQGEAVKKVTVDGKDFFGDDASLALKNLPSEIVDRVQVFDRMSDQARFTGFDDGSSQKGLNIVTKNGKNNGVFGKVYAGYGYLTDSRYSAGGIINWFNGDRRLSLLGMSNNVNQQNFSMQDLLGVTGGSQRGGGMGRGMGGGGRNGGWQPTSPADNFLVSQQGGISVTHSAGFNYSDVWGKRKKVKTSGSYFFNMVTNKNTTELNRQYFNSGDSSTFYQETNTTSGENMNHRANLRIEYTIDTANSLTFTPKFSWQQNKQNNGTIANSNTAGNELLSSTSSQYTAKSKGYNLSADLLYQHRFKLIGRTISIQATSSVNNKTGNSAQNSFSRYTEQNDSAAIDQQTDTRSFNYTASGNLTYTEPAGRTGLMSFSYQPSYNWNQSDKQTNNFNSLDNSYNLTDSILSNQYDYSYHVEKAGFSYRFREKGVNFSVGGNMQYAVLNGHQYFPYGAVTSKSFLNLLPTSMLNIKFSDSSNIRIFYRTATNPPSITQLQSVIDNSNPLLLSAGNPDLKQNYSHFFMTRFGFTNNKKAQSFFAFASVNYTAASFTNAIFIADKDTLLNGNVLLRAGSQLSKPINIDGNVNVNSFFTYALPLNKIKCNLNFNLGYNYLRNPSLINNATNVSNTHGINAGVVLSSNISEKIDFTVNYNATYNIVKNTLQKNSDNNYFNHTASVKFNWQFWKGFVFNTNLQNTLYAGVSQGFNQNFFLLNASLGYKFLKDKNLEVKFSANDILNQNTGVTRIVTETYVEDSKTQVLKRYLLLTLTYDLRFFKKQ